MLIDTHCTLCMHFHGSPHRGPSRATYGHIHGHKGTHTHTKWHKVLIIMSGKINFESRAFYVGPHAQQAPSTFTASLLSVFWQREGKRRSLFQPVGPNYPPQQPTSQLHTNQSITLNKDIINDNTLPPCNWN